MGGQNSHNTQNTKSVTISTLFPNLNNKESKQERNTYFPSINKIIPNEILKKILGYLDYKNVCNALQTCKHWRQIVDEFRFVEEASSKLFQHYFLDWTKLKEKFLYFQKECPVLL